MRKLAFAALVAALLGACSVYEPTGEAGSAAGAGGSAGAIGAGGAGGAGNAGDGGASSGAAGTTTGGDGGDSGSGGSTGGAGPSGQGGAGGTAGTSSAGTAGSPGGGGAGSGGSGGSGGFGGSTGGGAGGKPIDADASQDAPADVVKDAAVDAVPDVVVRPDGPGCAGHALLLSGFGYVVVNRPVQDDFTLEAWVKTTAAPAGTTYPEGNGVFYADKGMMGNDFGSSVVGGKFAFGVGNGPTSAAMTTVLSTTNVATGQWVHVAATRNKTTGAIQVFVNGNMEAAQTVSSQKNSLSSQTSMTIGGNTVDFHYFDGAIDEVRAWNVVRTGAEITQTMHQRLAGNEPGLVGYWRFDEGTGTTATDSTATKNNGSLSGVSNWIDSDAPICP